MARSNLESRHLLDLPWLDFTKQVMKMSESSLLLALKQESSEVTGRRRPQHLARLYSRMSKLRRVRERTEFGI